MLLVSGLYIYPVKSLGGISIEKSAVERRGLEFDRRWMLVDEKNQFISQRQVPRMALLKTSIVNKNLLIRDGNSELSMPLQLTGGRPVKVTVWSSRCQAMEADASINNWFSEKLSIACRAVFMPDDSERKIDPLYAVSPQDITGFADGYPVLMVGQASLDHLNQKLDKPILMDRFRPNIVFTGAAAYAEDKMKKFSIQQLEYAGVKPCSRCIMTCTNQQTAEVKKEPLKTLAGYRKFYNKILFGQNVIPSGEGMIAVGDEIRLL